MWKVFSGDILILSFLSLERVKSLVFKFRYFYFVAAFNGSFIYKFVRVCKFKNVLIFNSSS